MKYLDRLLEGILEELHNEFDGQPLEPIKKEARELLEESILDLDATLEAFLEPLRVCRRCGMAWHECDMEEADDEDGAYHMCRNCS
jgi:hypothetical protein